MKNVPVLISAYSRPSHLNNCLKSLESCELAKDTSIYITIDAPSSKDLKKINDQVHEVANKNWNFKSLKIISPEINTNGEIIKDTAKQLLIEHNYLIMTEEDNVFSYDFLKYMNWALNNYEEDKNIMTVSAWCPDDISYNNHSSVFLYPGYCAWGVGLWHSKSNNLIISREKQYKFFLNKLSNIKLSISYFLKANHLQRAIYNYFYKKNEAGDRYIDFKIFCDKKYSLFPGISRVKNNGHDGSGINSKISNEPSLQRIATGTHNYFLEQSGADINDYSKRIYEHYRLSFWKRLILNCLFPFFYIYILILKVNLYFKEKF